MYNFKEDVPDLSDNNLEVRETGGDDYLYYNDPNDTYSDYILKLPPLADESLYYTDTVTNTSTQRVTASRNGEYPFGTIPFDYGSFASDSDHISLRIGGSQNCYDEGCDPSIFNRYTGNISDMVSHDLSQYSSFRYPQDTRFRTVTVEERSISDEAINFANDTSNGVDWSDVSIRKENIEHSLRADWSSPFNSPTQVQIILTPTRIEDSPIPSGTDRGSVIITETNDPTVTGTTDGSLNTSRGGDDVSVVNNLEKDVNYTAFEAEISVKPQTDKPMNNTSLENLVIKNFNPQGNGSLEIRDTEISTSGTDNTVPAGSTNGGEGGSVLYNTRLSQDLESPSEITGRWVIRDNSVEIDQQTISSQDGSVLSGEINWRELQDKGITPRAEPYEVDFILEKGNGWSQERVKIGEIVIKEQT
jgi:hypothetical protein